MLAGDTAGFVDVPSLKGIHYAMQSGMYAARTAFAALKTGDVTGAALSRLRPHGGRQLHRGRHAPDPEHAARVQGRILGRRREGRADDPHAAAAFPAAGSTCPRTRPRPAASRRPRRSSPTARSPSASWTRCSNRGTRRATRSRRISSWARDVAAEVADFYTHVCPAGVYERVGDELRVNPPNCVDCKATDVLGPRWTPREGGSGPKYRLM